MMSAAAKRQHRLAQFLATAALSVDTAQLLLKECRSEEAKICVGRAMTALAEVMRAVEAEDAND
jgi:hypothetical protein